MFDYRKLRTKKGGCIMKNASRVLGVAIMALCLVLGSATFGMADIKVGVIGSMT